jgi:type VI secretion system protein ImpA
MSTIDVSALLAEVSEDQPCGEDMEYDPAFTELEIAAQGTEEQEYGDTVIEAEEPNWAEVEELALAVLQQSKDLRAALHLTRALLKSDGFSGLNQALELFRGYVEQYWETVHPQLDPDDDNDPTLRVNILVSLADDDTMLRSIRAAPLTDSRMLGRFGLRDIGIASGQLRPPEDAGEQPADMTVIESAFQDTDPERIQTMADAVRSAAEHATQIESMVTDLVGAGNAPDLSELVTVLKEAGKVLNAHLENPEALEEDEDAEGSGAQVAGVGGGAPISGSINNTNDVIRMLDKICDYYLRSEPSSPVPLLLNRAKRLVSKDFMTIMKDLAPGGVSEVASVGGIEEDE